jgi:hypothetical protein
VPEQNHPACRFSLMSIIARHGSTGITLGIESTGHLYPTRTTNCECDKGCGVPFVLHLYYHKSVWKSMGLEQDKGEGVCRRWQSVQGVNYAGRHPEEPSKGQVSRVVRERGSGL